MGQYFHTHCAWLCTKIADVLHHRKRPILIAHSGANMFPRQAYTSIQPPFKYDALMNEKNREKTVSYDIAGPLCFAGDRVEESVLLPKMDTKDWLVVDSVGANTFSLYSMHCSWPFPKVIAYNENQNLVKIIKKRMQVDDIIKFWS
jgi:diaminopimelate decarboxylase